MQKRVGLARAIAHEPEILFFDEPTTGLDPIMADVINELIVRCVKQLGATALSITHDMASVRKIADRVAMLYGGRIVWQGPVGDRSTTAATRSSTSSSTAAPRARSRSAPARSRARWPGRNAPSSARAAAPPTPRWAGRCDDCGAWNSIVEEATASPAPGARRQGARPAAGARAARRQRRRRRRASPAGSTSSTACWAAASCPVRPC